MLGGRAYARNNYLYENNAGGNQCYINQSVCEIEIIDTNEIENIIKKSNHITLALCDNNISYIVTMSYGYDINKKYLYFHCANKGDKLDYIKKNSNVIGTIIKDNGYLKTRCDHDYESLIIRERYL